MCGIVGMFGVVGAEHEKAFRDMLMLDQVRGEHSTGVAVVARNNINPKVAKAVGGATNLFDLKSYDKAFEGVNRVVIGHNRYATVGAVTAANAHPFTRGAITGVHNGSLTGYTNLEGYGQFAVDSEILYNHIAEYGLADALQNTYGAMALMWWNADTETVNIYRNDERPLHWATTTDDKVCFVASEPWMIEVAAARSRVTIKLNPVQEVPIHKLYSIEIPDNHYGVLPEPTVSPLESRKQVYMGNVYSGWTHRNYVAPQNSASTSANASASQNSDVQKEEVKGDVIPFPRKDAPTEIPKGVLCTYYSKERLWDYEWAVFYEVVGSREFVLPIAVADKLGINIGDTVSGDCNGIIYSPATGHNKEDRIPYYKLNELTLTEEEAPFQGALIDEGDDAEETVDSDGVPFLDSKGNQTDRASWYKQYGSCANCDGDVEHNSLFRFNQVGGVYCEECNTNPAVADALPA